MAKTGTSLIGRADTTLVQGAYKTALSNVGLDMSKIYEQEVEDIKAFGEAFNDIVYATNKSNNDLFAEIKEGSSEMLANIDAGTYTDDEFIEIYSGAVQDLREQMKTIPRGKEGEAARAKVRAQLARMKVSAENAEDVLTELATFAKEDQLDQFATSDVDVKLFRDIINKTAKRSIVNGELVYTNDVGDTITHNQLKERIIKKDHKTTGELLNVFNNISTYAQQEGAVFNDAYIRKTAQEISSKFTTRAGFLHTINNPIAGMEFSFVQAIGQDEELRTELVTALKQSGVDISDKASAAAVISELRNPSNQNLALVKGIASQYLAEKGGQIAFNLGKNLRKKDKKDSDSVTGLFYDETNNKQTIPAGRPMSNGYQQKFPPSYINQQLQNLQDGKDVILGGKLFRWVDPENTGESAWHFADSSTGKFVKVGDGTAQSMIRNEFRISGGKRINDTSKIVTEPPVIVDKEGNPVTQTSVENTYITQIENATESRNVRSIRNVVRNIFKQKEISIDVQMLGSNKFRFSYKPTPTSKPKEVIFSLNKNNDFYMTTEQLVDEINRALQTTVSGSIPGEDK